MLERLAGVEACNGCDPCTAIRTASRSGCRYIAAHPRVANTWTCAAAREPQRPGSNEARLKRRRFLQLLDRIRKTIPGVALRTSFIVGFPGKPMRTSANCAASCKRRSLTGWACSSIRTWTMRRASRSMKKLTRYNSGPAESTDGNSAENIGAQTAAFSRTRAIAWSKGRRRTLRWSGKPARVHGAGNRRQVVSE